MEILNRLDGTLPYLKDIFVALTLYLSIFEFPTLDHLVDADAIQSVRRHVLLLRGFGSTLEAMTRGGEGICHTF